MMASSGHFILADLLTIDPHTPSPEPVKYVKSEDGKWYTHDGVDVQETLQRKGNVNFILFPWKSSPLQY